VAAGGGIGFGLRNRAAAHAAGRAVGRRKRTLVTEELHHLVAGVDQGEAIGRAVLQARRRRDRDHRGAVSAALVGGGARQVVGAVLHPAVAVVEHDLPAGEVGARRRDHLDLLVAVGAAVVVVEFIDEHIGLRRREHDQAAQAQAEHGK
jgi:hypothetical protein